MKIDIHTHTRKYKKGDPETRDIAPEDFCERVTGTDVRIIAITNHNAFDLAQFEAIVEAMDNGVQVWPGIELDILDGSSRGHLLVVASPDQATRFAEVVADLTDGSTPDEFSASMRQVLASFDSLGPLYVAHYRQKRPNLSDDAVDELIQGTSAPARVLKEVTNAISAGIYISHGHASIYGSDVQDWERYGEHARELPDLRLPVDSFEHFCLLLEKDATTINTALNRKTPEQLVLQPFGDSNFIKLTFYNDINVIFGAKGTGKSCILKAIVKHYASNGVDVQLFESGGRSLDDLCDLKGTDLRFDLAEHGLESGATAIDYLRTAKEADVTALSKYVHFYATATTNRNAKRILLKDIDPEEEGTTRRAFEEATLAVEETARFLKVLRGNSMVREELGLEDFSALERLVSALLERLRSRAWQAFGSWKEVQLLNSAVRTFRFEVARKTGKPDKPVSTGFVGYAANRIVVERHASTVLGALATTLPVQIDPLGSLGENKGELALRTEFRLQDGTVRDGSYAPITGVRKNPQREFAMKMRDIRASAFRPDLFECIAEWDGIEGGESISTLRDLVLFNRGYLLEGAPYVPSTGEAAMVLLERELRRDADILVIDEPEKSLGNEYISEVIVPLIKGHALAGKRIFLSTHDANIAVRTLPYCSVYRSHDLHGFKTYVGNPFTNDLINLDDEEDRLDWRLISMRTLEGGEMAFGERGRIYGKS